MKLNLVILLVALTGCTSSVRPDSTDRPPIEFLNPPAASTTLPFSQAVRLGDTLYLAGQLGNVPGTLELAPGGIQAETRQTMENIQAVLERYGSSLADVVKCTVMLADIAEWGQFNEVYKTFFDPPYPARSAFGASGLAIDARVEVECIAAAPST